MRREVNELDWKTKLPFVKNTEYIDMSLIRRFLYQHDLKVFHLFSQEQIAEHQRLRDKVVKTREKKFMVDFDDNDKITSRFELMDVEE